MRTLTIFLISLFSLPLALNAQSVDEMLQKVSAAIEAGQNGQAVSYFRQTIALNIDRTEMYYWTNVDKNSEISSKLATELALAYKKNYYYLTAEQEKKKLETDYKKLSSPTKMQYARYRDGLSKLFTTRYEKARNSLQKVILRFPSTEAQKTLDKILRIEKEVNR